jgi:hypothetical protein
MRASEFVTEEVTTKIRKDHAQAMPGAHLARDPSTVDRLYHMNRMMMAMAMADGKSKKPVEMDTSSWAEKYNTIHPYTPEEHNMVYQALATLPTTHKHPVADHRSIEADDVHKVSPVTGFKGYAK